MLQISKSAERIALLHGGAESLVYALSTVRGRDLLRATYRLADAGFGLESTIVARVLLENMIVMKWVALDGALNAGRWYLKDLQSELTWDRSWRQAAEKEGRWRHPVGLPPERIEAARREVKEMTDAGIQKAPDIEQMSTQIGLFDAYPILYRMYCGLTHGSTIALFDHMLAAEPEDGVCRIARPALGQHMNSKPYWMPGLILASTLQVACDKLGFSWRDEVDAIEHELRAGPREIADGGPTA